MCLSSGIRLSMLRGSSGGDRGEMHESSTQAVELGSFFFFFFFFWGTFFLPRQVEYSAEYCRRSETARERVRKEREREKETEETERSDNKKSP